MKKETKFYATAMVDGGTIKKGEKFEIIKFDDESKERWGRLFVVISKITGNKIYCLEDECAHLEDGNWKITEE